MRDSSDQENITEELPVGTKIICPCCQEHLYDTVNVIFRSGILSAKDFKAVNGAKDPVTGNPVGACPECYRQWCHIVPFGGLQIYTEFGWWPRRG